MPIPVIHRNEPPHEAPTAQTDHPAELVEEINGIRIEKSIIVNRDRGQLYHFWRDSGPAFAWNGAFKLTATIW